jgi:hypothetical protein
MKIDRIIVAYWVPSKYMEEQIGIDHESVYDYSKKKRDEIIDLALEKDMQVMMIKRHEVLIIYIDNGRFRQR